MSTRLSFNLGWTSINFLRFLPGRRRAVHPLGSMHAAVVLRSLPVRSECSPQKLPGVTTMTGIVERPNGDICEDQLLDISKVDI